MILHVPHYIFGIVTFFVKLSTAFITFTNDTVISVEYSSLFKEKFGEESSIAEFPYLVSVRIEDIHICTGSLYSTNLAITSAQCCYDWVIYKISGKYVQHAADLVTLLLSSSVLDYVDPSENIPTEVEFILAHEGFDFNTLENDIALLKLARPLKTTQFAPLLPVNNFWGINDLQGEECMLAGWGAFRFIISEFVNQWNITERLIMVNETASLLQKTSLDVVTPAECSLLTPHSLWKMDNLLCAYKGGKSACVGDAGSPLICDGYVVGFLSWHGGCVRDTPGVFHRIDKLMGWLKRAIYRSRMQIQYRSKAPAASQNLTFLLFITVLFKYN